MTQMTFSKLTAVPTTFAPSTVYFVSGSTTPTDLAIYVSDSAGNAARHTATYTEMVNMMDTKIASAVSAAASIKIVNNIADRNALLTPPILPTTPLMALVLDATSDITVASGAATYVWSPATQLWSKISEYESMDVLVQWNSIVGRPTATPAEIDSLLPVLSTVTQLSSVGGQLQFGGSYVVPQLLAEQW
jgi:hypothetical protein